MIMSELLAVAIVSISVDAPPPIAPEAATHMLAPDEARDA
jgi:hypothetical protein